MCARAGDLVRGLAPSACNEFCKARAWGIDCAKSSRPLELGIRILDRDANADLLRGDMTADEMREIIRRKLEEEGLLPPRQVVEHQESKTNGITR